MVSKTELKFKYDFLYTDYILEKNSCRNYFHISYFFLTGHGLFFSFVVTPFPFRVLSHERHTSLGQVKC